MKCVSNCEIAKYVCKSRDSCVSNNVLKKKKKKTVIIHAIQYFRER